MTRTTSTALLEALAEAGVRYLFANLGSDHPGLIEAYARARAEGRAAEFPELIVCPHESVAFSAAQGYAQVTGVPQAVLVHVECGTQNIGGMLHNAAKGRVPVLVFAGASPVTQEGELPGSRNEFIHWLQDVRDQRGIVRGYMKYDYEIRTGQNIRQVVFRALQIARSEPAGPVYLMGAREVMDAEVPRQETDPAWFTPVTPVALAPSTVEHIAEALAEARKPVVVTSYLGADPAAVPVLVDLCELAALPVIQSAPTRFNFPSDHPLHWGFQWNTTEPNPLLAGADLVLVLGSDVPWIPSSNRPDPDARLFVVDVDPVKEQIPLWHVPAECFARADLRTAVTQIADALRGRIDPELVSARGAGAAGEHENQQRELAARERPEGERITVGYLLSLVRQAIDENTLVLFEAVTGYQAVCDHVHRSVPGSLIGSGGSSLGWYAGAAIGAKLAAPERTVVSIVGDGTYLFGVPASAHWVARRYHAPSLTIVLDNRGWKAPKLSALSVHPDGAAALNDEFDVSFEPEADLPGIAAAAGGAWARTVRLASEAEQALGEALDAVRNGRSAVLSVHLDRV